MGSQPSLCWVEEIEKHIGLMWARDLVRCLSYFNGTNTNPGYSSLLISPFLSFLYSHIEFCTGITSRPSFFSSPKSSEGNFSADAETRILSYKTPGVPINHRGCWTCELLISRVLDPGSLISGVVETAVEIVAFMKLYLARFLLP